MNQLYFGDNLDILKELYHQHPQGFIDLILHYNRVSCNRLNILRSEYVLVIIAEECHNHASTQRPENSAYHSDMADLG